VKTLDLAMIMGKPVDTPGVSAALPMINSGFWGAAA